METISGYPPCPECDKILSLRSMPDAGETYWHCTGCGTQWSTPDLIRALNNAEDVACVVATEEMDNGVQNTTTETT